MNLSNFSPDEEFASGTTPPKDSIYHGEEPKNIDIYDDDKDKNKFLSESTFPEIEIMELKDSSITLLLSNCDLSIANALRRIIISEVPTLAFDFIDIQENTTVLDDEFIAHRLGLIPLLSKHVESFRYARECSCEDGCEFCAVRFECNVHNTTNETLFVTQKNLKNVSPIQDQYDIRPVYEQKGLCNGVIPVTENYKHNSHHHHDNKSNDDEIVLVKLGPNQKIKFNAIARKGIGKEHAKFQPVSVISFIHDPYIRLQDDLIQSLTTEKRKEFVESCPTKVYGYDPQTRVISVDKPRDCTYCEECIRKAEEFDMPELVHIRPYQNRYILTIETTGSMSPDQVVLLGLKILRLKLKELKEHVKQLKRQ